MDKDWLISLDNLFKGPLNSSITISSLLNGSVSSGKKGSIVLCKKCSAASAGVGFAITSA